MAGRWVVLVLVSGCLAMSPGVGTAAEFQLVDDLSTGSASPVDATPPCTRNVGATAFAFESGGVANFQAFTGTTLVGSDASCNETGTARTNGHGLFALAPTVENPGDTVTVCLNVQLLNVAAALNHATAAIDQKSILLLAKSGTSSRVLLRLPGDHFSAIGNPGSEEVVDQSEFQCGSEVTMAVGEQLEGFLGATASSKIVGISRAEEDANYEVAVKVGECEAEFTECPMDPVSAPALSPLPLAALGALMLLSGVVVRRRKARNVSLKG